MGHVRSITGFFPGVSAAKYLRALSGCSDLQIALYYPVLSAILPLVRFCVAETKMQVAFRPVSIDN
jgi:hypothetical protein